MNRVVDFKPLLLLLLVFPGCSPDSSTKPPATDTMPPAVIENLYIQSHPDRRVTLVWRIPGNDGMEGRASRYDIRYAADSLTELTWTDAPSVASPPIPGPAGGWETFEVSGLPSGTWYFAIKTADAIPNWSGLSKVVRGIVADLIPPGQVTDLTVLGAEVESITLTWTAPGNDGTNGRAAEYDLRYDRIAITGQTWSTATPVQGLPAPSVAGTVDSCAVGGLEPGTTYYFALKTADLAPNWSSLSNVISASTMSASLRRLTFSPSGRRAWAPAWSPNAQEVAFSADWSGNAEIYRMPAGGGDPIRLTSNAASDDHPSCSPDGRKIAFSSDRGGRIGLWVMDAADGLNPVFLADEDAEAMMFVSRATWSPDGTRIAYVVGTPWSVVAPTKIYTVPSDGGPADLLITGGEWANFDPAWSPDGTRMAFVSTPDLRVKIWIKPMGGGDAIRLSSGPGQDLQPSWSPDGDRIAFRADRTGSAEIWVMTAAGGGLTQLTFSPMSAWEPAWSPDGQRIAFSSPTDGNLEIWVLQME